MLKIIIVFIYKSCFSEAMFHKQLEIYCTKFYSCRENQILIFSYGVTIFFVFSF